MKFFMELARTCAKKQILIVSLSEKRLRASAKIRIEQHTYFRR